MLPVHKVSINQAYCRLVMDSVTVYLVIWVLPVHKVSINQAYCRLVMDSVTVYLVIWVFPVHKVSVNQAYCRPGDGFCNCLPGYMDVTCSQSKCKSGLL